MKQTAVEWLVEEMLKQGYFDGNKPLTYTNLDHLQQQAKEMEEEQSFVDVNRVEVIQHSPPYNGRAYTNYNAKDVELQLQDNNKTLKIFLK
jgi:hypothetical protein